MSAPAEVRRRRIARVVGVVAFAIGLGVLADLGPQHPNRAYFLKELGAPWFVLAFMAGRLPRSRIAAAIAGTAAVAIGLASFAMVVVASSAYVSVGDLAVSIHDIFLVAAVVLGPVMGIAGHFSSEDDSRIRAIGWGALSGVVLAEGVGIATNVGFLGGPSSMAVLAAVAAVAIAVLGSRRGARIWLLASAASVCVGALIAVSVIDRVVAVWGALPQTTYVDTPQTSREGLRDFEQLSRLRTERRS